MMTKNDLIENLKTAKRVAIFAHKNPDPDAYGSMFGARELCKMLKVKADVFAVKNPDGYLDKIFPLNELKTDFDAKKYDLVLLMDLNEISRLEPCFREEVQKAKNIFIVDHHDISPEKALPSEKHIIKPQTAAASQILTEILMKNKLVPNKQFATYLWMGLIGDTDRFLHPNLTTDVLKCATFLFEAGAEAQKVYDAMYRSTTKKQLKLHQEFIEKINFVENDTAAFVIFTIKDMKKLGVDKEEIKMYVNEMVRVEGVRLSILCMEYRKDYFKISLRSNGIDLVPFTTKMGGGGHTNAAAFEGPTTKKEILKNINSWMREILYGSSNNA